MSELVAATSKAVEPFSGFGTDASFDISKVILPILTIRQNTYKNEAVKKFRAGDIVLRPDMRVVADESKVFQVIPLSFTEITKVLEVMGSETRLIKTEAVDPSKEFSWTEGSKIFRRDICHIVYFLPVESAKAQTKAMLAGQLDPDDFVLPIRVTFTRGSLHAGKVIGSHFETCKLFNAPSYGKVYDLRSEARSNDKGNWFVFNVTPALEKDKNMKTPKDVISIASFWSKVLANSQNSIKVVPEDDTEIVDVSAELPTNF